MSKRALLLMVVLLIGLLVGAWWLLRPGDDAEEMDVAQEPAGPSVAEPDPHTPAVRDRTSPARRERRTRKPGRRRMTPAQHRARLMAILKKLRDSTQATSGSTGSGTMGALPAGEPEKTPTLTAKYIKAAVKEIVPLFKQCYEAALEKEPGLGGKLVVSFEIVGDPDLGGLVTNSHVDAKRSDSMTSGLRECVRETMYALDLVAPEKGGTTKVSYPLRFRAKGEPKKKAEAPAKNE